MELNRERNGFKSWQEICFFSRFFENFVFSSLVVPWTSFHSSPPPRQQAERNESDEGQVEAGEGGAEQTEEETRRKRRSRLVWRQWHVCLSLERTPAPHNKRLLCLSICLHLPHFIHLVLSSSFLCPHLSCPFSSVSPAFSSFHFRKLSLPLKSFRFPARAAPRRVASLFRNGTSFPDNARKNVTHSQPLRTLEFSAFRSAAVIAQ